MQHEDTFCQQPQLEGICFSQSSQKAGDGVSLVSEAYIFMLNILHCLLSSVIHNMILHMLLLLSVIIQFYSSYCSGSINIKVNANIAENQYTVGRERKVYMLKYQLHVNATFMHLLHYSISAQPFLNVEITNTKIRHSEVVVFSVLWNMELGFEPHFKLICTHLFEIGSLNYQLVTFLIQGYVTVHSGFMLILLLVL